MQEDVLDIDDIVLKKLAKSDDISQRKLASETNLSLGSLNLVLHRLAQKGLVKIEKINSRNLKYILTPKGIARNTVRTGQFIRFAFKQIMDVQACLVEQTNLLSSQGYTLYIVEEDDEIYDMVSHIKKEKKLSPIHTIKHIEEIKTADDVQVFVWTPQQEALCQEKGIGFINPVIGR